MCPTPITLNFYGTLKIRGESLKKYEGKIDVLYPPKDKIKAEEILYIHMPREKGEARMSQSLHNLFLPYKNKNVKITIEEIK